MRLHDAQVQQRKGVYGNETFKWFHGTPLFL